MKKMPILWILKRIRNRIPEILLMTAAQIGDALFAVLFALCSRAVIDSAAEGDSAAFLHACGRQGIIIAGILACLVIFRHLRDRLAADLERDWKRQLLHGLLHGEYSAVSAYHSAELLNRLNNDVEKVNNGILLIIPSTAALLVRMIAAVTVLGILDALFAGMIILIGVLAIGVTGLIRRHLKELNKLVSTHDGIVSGFLQETMEKLLIVQAMDVTEEVEKRAELLMADRYGVQRKRKNVSLIANTCVSLMYYGVGFATLAWCAYRLLQGQMSFGSLTAVIQLVNQLQSPFVKLSGVFPQYLAMTASAERLMDLEAIEGEPETVAKNPGEMYDAMVSLNAQGLSFSYGRDQIFREVEFSLPKGAFAVITGPSGIGKSTLLKLLLGVFHPEKGYLYLDCGEEKTVLNRSTRSLFAYLPQGNLLFSGTIRDNLTIVKPDATEEELDHAVYISAMDEYLPGLPLGLDTRLGESGAGLSEGQLQRLAIARAVLGGAPVLLLDECTSALDAETEQLVLKRLKALPNRMCIVVTHRPAAVDLCDWQLEIAEGKICTVPTHSDCEGQ